MEQLSREERIERVNDVLKLQQKNERPMSKDEYREFWLKFHNETYAKMGWSHPPECSCKRSAEITQK
jgi:hypothetical protein